jgi:hypothetical protein
MAKSHKRLSILLGIQVVFVFLPQNPSHLLQTDILKRDDIKPYRVTEVLILFLPIAVTLLIIKPTICTNFSNLFCIETLHVSDSSSVHHQEFSLYTQQWYMSYRFVDTIEMFHPDPARKLFTNLYDICHCGMYSEKLLMMDRGTVRNM